MENKFRYYGYHYKVQINHVITFISNLPCISSYDNILSTIRSPS